MRNRYASALLCAMLLFFATLASAQLSTGSLEGTVADNTGAVLTGAKLTIKNQATGATFTTTSNEAGIYRFAVLPVGIYDLAVEHSGFGAATRKDIHVTVGSKIDLPISLSVAARTDSVDVTAETPLVETTRTSVSSTVGDRSIANLPVNGRNFIDFVLLTPGVTRDVRTGDISFAGQRGTLNSLTVDGSDNNNTFFGQTVGRTGSGRAPYQFSQDAVQEFQVNSNSYSAELGRAGGAVINVVTKSGTNAFHGAGFWFYRDRGLNATDPIVKLNSGANARKPAYHFNQFGGNVGGPIVKNRLFFFFDYDGQRNTQPNSVILNLPNRAFNTDEQRAVDYLRARANSWDRTQDQDAYLFKLDGNINRSNIFSARWNRQNFTGGGFENGGNQNSFEHTGASIVKTDTVALSVTSTLSPSVVNVARYSYVRDKEPGQANSILPEATVREAGQTMLVVGRNSFSPRETTLTRHQWADTLSWSKGRHNVKVGADLVYDRILNFFPGNFSGVYTFNSLENFGRSLANLPLNTTGVSASALQYAQAFAGTGTTGAKTNPNIFEASWFVQDDWRVTSNFTLNLGLRYDVQGMARPKVLNQTASLASAGLYTSRLNEDTNNFGPRIGFAYSPLGDKRMVVRGGYGVFYGRTPSIMLGTAHSNNGINVQTRTWSLGAMPSYPNTMCGAPVASPNCPAPTGGSASTPSIYVFSKDFVQPFVQQANLGVEYQLGQDWALNVSYLGVKGSHLQRTRDINLGTPTPATISVANGGPTYTYLRYPSTRPIAGFQRISQFESNANSIYHGMTVQLTKRLSHNFQGSAAYTWGKVIDDAPDATSVVPFSSGDDAKMISDPLNIRADRAPGSNDQRHRFVLSGIWQLNYANELPAVAKAIFGGWELSGILSAQSGQPYSGIINFDLNNDSNRQTDRTPTTGRNAFTLPSTWSFDPRLTKSIPITEKAKLQIIAEAFNIFNRFNVTAVRNQQYAVSTVTASSNPCGTGAAVGTSCLVPQNTGLTAFQTPSSTNNGYRIFQLGAKFTF